MVGTLDAGVDVVVAQVPQRNCLQVRLGLHSGESEVIDDKITGIAVHIGARVASLAKSGEILVSRTVKDLVAGSGIEFEDRGAQTLKGGAWRVASL
jgi:class 3 adenylate cyclase